MMNTLMLFSNDLRVHDNLALQAANEGADSMLCVYIKPKWFSEAGRFGYSGAAEKRQEFLEQSLLSLSQSLANIDQQLWILNNSSLPAVIALVENSNISRIVSSHSAGWYEQKFWALLKQHLQHCQFLNIHTHTLFSPEQFPFDIKDLPSSFSQFRKRVEHLRPIQAEKCAHFELAPPLTVNPALHSLTSLRTSAKSHRDINSSNYVGGEGAALAHAQRYFSSSLPSNYKEVRNSLDGFEHSTKFSPWLAHGSISVRRIRSMLDQYESTNGGNESTYWIYFELLWREFFQWNAHKLGKKLFYLGGAQSKPTLSSYYPERFQKWANGNTPYPLVNAIMRELLATGYISNRARQITASCFVNELGLDWRYGATWFERHLLDYDVASNWGNWQYLAGVGADVKPKRHFNLEKQTTQFDSKRNYINLWSGDANGLPLDSVDAADWPIT